MQHKSWMSLEPSADLGVGMRAVVVHDQVERSVGGDLLVQSAQELEKFLGAGAVRGTVR